MEWKKEHRWRKNNKHLYGRKRKTATIIDIRSNRQHRGWKKIQIGNGSWIRIAIYCFQCLDQLLFESRYTFLLLFYLKQHQDQNPWKFFFGQKFKMNIALGARARDLHEKKTKVFLAPSSRGEKNRVGQFWSVFFTKSAHQRIKISFSVGPTINIHTKMEQ